MSNILKKELLLYEENLVKEIETTVLTSKQKISKTANLILIKKLLEIDRLNDLIMKTRRTKGISLRKGSTIVVEEYLQLKIEANRDNCDMEQMFKIALKRFKIINRNKVPLRNIDNFHPEDPAYRTEEFGFNMSSYKKLIDEIVLNKWWLIDDEVVVESFEAIHNEIKFS